MVLLYSRSRQGLKCGKDLALGSFGGVEERTLPLSAGQSTDEIQSRPGNATQMFG